MTCSFGWGSNFQICWQTQICPSLWNCTLDEVFGVIAFLARDFSVLGILEMPLEEQAQ